MRLSETSDLSFYPDAYQEKRGCHVSRLGIFLIVLAFVVSLLVVGLTVGLVGRPKGDSNSATTVIPPKTTVPPTTEFPPGGDTSYRLPRALFPLHYDLTMKPDLDPSK